MAASSRRLTVWVQHTNRMERPWRRKTDSRYVFHFVPKAQSWSDVWPLIGRRALRVQTFYDRILRERVTQVFIGTRGFLKEHFAR